MLEPLSDIRQAPPMRIAGRLFTALGTASALACALCLATPIHEGHGSHLYKTAAEIGEIESRLQRLSLLEERTAPKVEAALLELDSKNIPKSDPRRLDALRQRDSIRAMRAERPRLVERLKIDEERLPWLRRMTAAWKILVWTLRVVTGAAAAAALLLCWRWFRRLQPGQSERLAPRRLVWVLLIPIGLAVIGSMLLLMRESSDRIEAAPVVFFALGAAYLLGLGRALPRVWGEQPEPADPVRAKRLALLALAGTLFWPVAVGAVALAAFSLGSLVIPAVDWLARDIHCLYFLTAAITAPLLIAWRWGRWHPRLLAAAGLRQDTEPETGVLDLRFMRIPFRRNRLVTAERDSSGLKPMACHLLALLAAAAACMAISHRVWHSRLDALRDEARAKGLAATLAAFHEELPPGANGYPEFDESMRGFDTGTLYRLGSRFQQGVHAWSKEDMEAARPVAAHYRKYMREKVVLHLERYTYLSAADYRRAPENPLAMPIPHYANHISAANAFGLLAGASAYEGDPRAAWREVADCLRLARLTGSDRTLLSQMIAVGVENACSGAALTVMLNAPGQTLPPDAARRLADGLALRRVRRALEAELAMHFDMQRHEAAGEKFGLEEDDAFARLLWRIAAGMGAVDANLLFVARRTLAAVREPPWDELKILWENEKNGSGGDRMPLWPFFLANIVSPPGGRARLYVRELETRAWSRLALAASALNAYRREKGRYPASLADLAPRFARTEDFSDPFGSSSLDYAADADGVSLSSAGAKGDKKTLGGRGFTVRLPRGSGR